MSAVLVWSIRVVLLLLLIGSLSLVAALILLVREAQGELRRAFGEVAMWCFSALGLLVSAMLVFVIARRLSRVVRIELSRRRLGSSRAGENQDGGL